MTKKGIVPTLIIALVLVALAASWFIPLPSLSLKKMTVEEATRLYVQREQRDQYYDWKRRINFYGKVVDQNSQPVPGVTADLIWNNMYAPGGSKETQILSNPNGLLSLTGETGKLLEVRVEKIGYYTAHGRKEPLAFEYADPSSPDYYEPDADNPVVFHLRKKGLNSATLIHWKRDVALNDRNETTLGLRTGYTTSGQSGSLFIQVLTNRYKFGDFAWSARISVIGGGIQLDKDQFPFLAPMTGYQPSVEVNMNTPKPPYWIDENGNAFYVQTPQGYGHYRVTMSLGVHWLEAEGFFNPNPTDRNLEPIDGKVDLY